jgi:serine/threonine protein kinase
MSGAPTVGVTPAADLWSFGVILYEALTGRRFYGTAPSTRVVLEAALGGSHLPTEVTNPGVHRVYTTSFHLVS